MARVVEENHPRITRRRIENHNAEDRDDRLYRVEGMTRQVMQQTLEGPPMVQPTLTAGNVMINGGQQDPVRNELQQQAALAVNRGQQLPLADGVLDTRPSRGRKRPAPEPERSVVKPRIIEPPYPWATENRAKVHSIETLTSKRISTISGYLQCRHCEQTSKLEYNVVEKFMQIWNFVCNNRIKMHERAPTKWMQAKLPACSKCGHENSLKPIIAEKKRNINWLFLFLGEMVGCCSLDQLKYFCKHTDNHRTGSKNRVLYLTYVTLCHQLYPNSPSRR